MDIKEFLELLLEEVYTNPNFNGIDSQSFSITSPIVREFKRKYDNGQSLESILFFYKYKDIE